VWQASNTVRKGFHAAITATWQGASPPPLI